MASRLGLVGCFIVIVALVLKGSSAATYTVGDGLTWTIPPGGEIAYRTWARSKSFNIGDVIGKHSLIFLQMSLKELLHLFFSLLM